MTHTTHADRLALAAWYLDALTPYRAAFNVMTPPGSKSKYFCRHEELTPAVIADALDGQRRDRGRGPILSIAAHRLQHDGRAMCAAIDIDKGGRAAVASCMAVAEKLGLWCFVSLSASEDHDGGHCWIPFAEPQDADLLLSVAMRIMRDAGVAGEAYPRPAALRLPAMTHLRAPGGPHVFPIVLPTGETLTGDSRAIVTALRERWQANPARALWEADSTLAPLTIAQPATRHKSEVDPGDSTRVIDWYNRTVPIEEALEDVGCHVDGRSKTYLCPFHDDHSPSMGILPHRHLDGVRVARCFAPHCKAHRTYTAFDIFCDANKLDSTKPEDRKVAVYMIAEANGLGRRKETRIETATTPAPTRRPYTLDTHLGLLAAQREALDVVLSDVAETAFTGGAERKRVLVIRAAPGTGKTTAAARMANATTAAGLRVAIVAPNHEHARREWAERLDNPFIWQPRKNLCTCFTSEDLDEWGRKGYAAPPCTDPECAYRRQKQAAQGKQVVFQHVHAGLRGGELLLGYDLVIIDESPIGGLLQEVAVTLGELEGLGRRAPACAPLCNALVKAANKHYHHEAYGPALVDTLHRYCDLDQALVDAQASDEARPHKPADGNKPAADLPRRFLPDLLAALCHDVEHPDRNALLTWGRTAYGWRYVYHRRAPFLAEAWKRLDGPAVVLLDSSADATIYRQLLAPWPNDMTVIGAPVSPVVRIVQAPGVGSTRRVLEEGRPVVVARHLAEIANKMGVVIDGGISYRDLAPHLAQHLGGDWSLHYGQQRGRNGLENAAVVAVVASPTVPPDAITREARALWHDGPPIDMTATRVGVADFAYTDDRLACVARAHGKEELRQAAHRARLVTRTTPTTVIMASPWPLAPLGLPVAATITELTAAQSAASRDALTTYQARRQLTYNVDFPAILDSAKIREAHIPPDSRISRKPTVPPLPVSYEPPSPKAILPAPPILAAVGLHRPRPSEPCPMCGHDAWYLRASPPAWVCGHCHPPRAVDVPAVALAVPTLALEVA